MKAVNLIPADSRRTGGSSPGPSLPVYLFLGVLAGALALVTIAVLTDNTIADRKAQLATLQAQVSSQQALVSQLANYAQFASVAQSRVQTVTGIAATRFHWHAVLSQLAQVVPGNTSLLSLQGTVAPGASAGGTGGGAGGSSGGLRAAVASPALELTGCTASQVDVARLISRLRVIDGVTRVTLGSSAKATTGGASGGSASGSSGCAGTQPAFDVLVFFSPLPGAGPTGAGSAPTAASPTTNLAKKAAR
jgi:Tfp pilus assembly protein PilN